MHIFKWLFTRRCLCRTTSGFENLELPNHVFKLQKALYGLKQAPRAWYEHVSKFLLFIKTKVEDFIIMQVYVGDILFGAIDGSLHKEFSNLMSKEFEMSMVSKHSSLVYKSNSSKMAFFKVK